MVWILVKNQSRDLDEADIDESMIIELAGEITIEDIYKKVFELYDVKVNSFLKDHTL